MKKEFKHIMGGYGEMSCPGCSSPIDISEPSYIIVIGNTKRQFSVPGLWTPTERCNNPMCEWSDINE